MKKIINFIIFIMLIIVSILFYSRFIGTTGLNTNEIVINDNNLSNSYDGLKIVHFSDIHYTRVITNNRVKELIDEINLLKPDIVFFTGDLIDTDSTPNDSNKQKLINYLKEIKTVYGKYAIIGNHDYDNHLDLVKEIYSLSNFTLLENSYDIIYNSNKDKIFIGGLNTVSFDLADIDKTMEYFKNNDDINYKIILVHEPDYADEIVNKYPDVNLILSGHSHGGQVRLPFIGGILKNSNAIKYNNGYYKVNNTKLYVSNGIGVSRYNFRLFNRPSINFYRIYSN